MFCDITGGAGGSTADLTLDIASKMQNMARLLAARAHAARCTLRLRALFLSRLRRACRS
jgi:hypothetical protein